MPAGLVNGSGSGRANDRLRKRASGTLPKCQVGPKGYARGEAPDGWDMPGISDTSSTKEKTAHSAEGGGGLI